MLDFHEKRKLRSLLYSKPVIIALLGFVVWMSLSVYERYASERAMAAKRYELEERLQGLQGQTAALKGEVERLQSERGIEEELRDRYEIAKKGEEVILIIDNASATTSVSGPRLKTEAGLMSRMKAFFAP